MNKNDILTKLNEEAHDEAAVTEVVGMVVLNDELLNQVSGGLAHSSGAICTISAECNGGSSCAPHWPWQNQQVQ